MEISSREMERGRGKNCRGRNRVEKKVEDQWEIRMTLRKHTR
jgi:hypothetical protein